AAVSDRRGEARFADSEWSWGGHLAVDGPSTRSVQCITLEDIISDYKIETIDILKVDIEGAEKVIFAGQVSWLKKIGCIIIELHNGYSLTDFSADLASMGFHVLPPGSVFGNEMVLAIPAMTARVNGNAN